MHPLQDHIVAGTLLTKRDTFLSRGEFMQLVYAACTPARPGMKDPCNLPCPLPALLKPEPLYTGKQVSLSFRAACGLWCDQCSPWAVIVGCDMPLGARFALQWLPQLGKVVISHA